MNFSICNGCCNSVKKGNSVICKKFNTAMEFLNMTSCKYFDIPIDEENENNDTKKKQEKIKKELKSGDIVYIVDDEIKKIMVVRKDSTSRLKDNDELIEYDMIMGAFLSRYEYRSEYLIDITNYNIFKTKEDALEFYEKKYTDKFIKKYKDDMEWLKEKIKAYKEENNE